MAKCAVCHTRKAKRECGFYVAHVCSVCCGTVRQEGSCGRCAFFRPPERDYDALPRYSTTAMQDSAHLQEISFPVEAGACLLDRARGFRLNDAEAIDFFELLLDFYAFGDSWETLSSRIDRLGCQKVVDMVKDQLRSYDREEIAKVLGVVRFVAKRRANRGRDHLDVLQKYCGAFVQRGVGRRRLSDGSDLLVGSL